MTRVCWEPAMMDHTIFYEKLCIKRSGPINTFFLIIQENVELNELACVLKTSVTEKCLFYFQNRR